VSKGAIVTGATSGIGRALAFELARRGWALGLCARRAELLEEVGRDLVADTSGTRVETEVLDVTELDAVREAIPRLAARVGDVRLVVANAGIGGGRPVGGDGFETDAAIVRTNLLGAMATVDAAVRLLRETGGGQIVGVSSVAGYRGLPGHAAYSASKAGLNAYLEAVRAEVQGAGITVTTLAPGYIDTPLNRHMRSRPFLVSAEEGARRAADLIERGVSESTVPVLPWSVVAFAMRHVPDVLWYRAMRSQVPRER
jgi:hypothetical protein